MKGNWILFVMAVFSLLVSCASIDRSHAWALFEFGSFIFFLVAWHDTNMLNLEIGRLEHELEVLERKVKS